MHDTETESLSPPAVHKESEDPWNKLCIDLEAIEFNYRYLRSQLPPGVVFYAVLKSDAYGHGLVEVAKVLSWAGCRHFAVESPQEGIRLRNEDIDGEILLMNPIPAWMAELAVRHDLSVSVIRRSILEPLEDAARLMERTCRIHINANVGLNRLGASPKKILEIAQEASGMRHLEMVGLFGQPRAAGSAADSYERLMEIRDAMQSRGLAPNRIHFANSTTFLDHPEFVADGVRIGIILYGVLPPEQYRKGFEQHPLRPAMSLETEIVQVRELPAGSRIGYRSRKKTERDLVIGTIPIGYNHGLNRKMLGGAYTLVRGAAAPFIGAISMNSSTIDITGVKTAEIGDAVTIIGHQGDREIDINELAEKGETIAAELMMGFGKSMPRIHRSGEEDIAPTIAFDRERREDIQIGYYQTSSEFPEGVTPYEIIRFLHAQLVPFHDREETIASAVDYALSSHPGGRGFVLLAMIDRRIVGALVCIRMHRIAIIPENLIVYLCVDREYRCIGLGSRMVREAMECCDGDVKLHVERSNPAVRFYRKLGFRDDYIEMRYIKKGE